MIAKKLIGWFESQARDLPWRKKRTAYKIWISEVMLQQTQVKQVIPYYIKFLNRFPDIASLAGATQQEILKMWEGMGYYARARNMHRAANIIIKQHDGQIPPDSKELLQLPGFGPYITNAVLSLAFNQPLSVIDGNVMRVISRIFAVRSDIRLLRTKKVIQKKIDALLDKKNPGKFNEAIMELGATICHPINPDCPKCPVNNDCMAFKNNLISKIPFKSKKAQRPLIRLSSYILSQNDQFLLVKRPENGLLGGLWEFPTFRDPKTGNQALLTWEEDDGQFLNRAEYKKTWTSIKHSYTHLHVKMKPYWYCLQTQQFKSDFYPEYKWIKIGDIADFPIHRATQKVLDSVREELEIISQ